MTEETLAGEIVSQRSDLAFWLWTALRTDLPSQGGVPTEGEDFDMYICVANAPSLAKDALSLGLVSGALKPDGPALSGKLTLTAAGAKVCEAFAAACKSVPADSPPRYTDEEYVRRAMMNVGHGRTRWPRWGAVMQAFGCGSTNAYELCARFGLDPDEMIGDEDLAEIEEDDDE